MTDFTKSERQTLRELAGEVYEAEAALLLEDLEASFKKWRDGELLPSELLEAIHEFHQDQSLHLDGTARHLEALIDAGVAGLIMCGSLGENQAMDADEKRRVVAMAVNVSSGRVPVLSGVASPDRKRTSSPLTKMLTNRRSSPVSSHRRSRSPG